MDPNDSEKHPLTLPEATYYVHTDVLRCNCYSGTHQGCYTHCHFRSNNSYLSISAHTVPPPWRKGELPEGFESLLPLLGRKLLTAHSDVQMCLSMIVSWIAMHMGVRFPLPSWL